jgi:hypothetical protein
MHLVWLRDKGPVVLLAEAQAKGWLGVRAAAERRLDAHASDYERACLAVRAAREVELVAFREGVALAFQTSGEQAALVPEPDGLVVAKWIHAESRAAADEAVTRRSPEPAWESTGLVWRVPGNGVRLHVAAKPFEGGGVSCALKGGAFAVDTAALAPDDQTSFVLWRLRRIPGRTFRPGESGADVLGALVALFGLAMPFTSIPFGCHATEAPTPAPEEDPLTACTEQAAKDSPDVARLEQSTRIEGSVARIYRCDPLVLGRLDLPEGLTDDIADKNLTRFAEGFGPSAELTRSIERVGANAGPAMTVASASAKVWSRMILLLIGTKQTLMLSCTAPSRKPDAVQRCGRLLEAIAARGAPRK